MLSPRDLTVALAGAPVEQKINLATIFQRAEDSNYSYPAEGQALYRLGWPGVRISTDSVFPNNCLLILPGRPLLSAVTDRTRLARAAPGVSGEGCANRDPCCHNRTDTHTQLENHCLIDLRIKFDEYQPVCGAIMPGVGDL